MAERRRGLGRGLGSLIPTAPEQEAKSRQANEQQAVDTNGKSGSSQGVSRETPEQSSSQKTARKGQAAKNATAEKSSSSEQATSESKNSATKAKVTSTKTTSKSTAKSKKSSASGSGAKATNDGGSQKAAPVSRETSAAGTENTDEVTSKAGNRKSGNARADMGAALRKSSGGRRPVDFFFQPSTAAQESVKAPSDQASESQEATPWAGRDEVSRETTPTNEDGAASKANAHAAASDGQSESSTDGTKLVNVPGAKFGEIPVGDIHPNRKQPRQEFDEDEMEELVHSIREIGLLQPIVVRPSAEQGPESYELVMGERRWRATQRAGLDTIPAIVRNTQDVDLLRDALLENLHRSQLNPLEEAAAYQQLLNEFGTTQDELAQRIGRSRPQISNTIRLLRLPALVQRRVAAGILSAGHARALLSLSDPASMERLAQRIVAEGLSVRSVEEIIQSGSAEKSAKPARKPVAPHRHHERLDYIADAFADKLDTSVKINLGARKGKMTIEFASVDDLNRIISVLDPQIEKDQ